MMYHDRTGGNRWLYLMLAVFLVGGIGLLTGGLLWFRSTFVWVRTASSASGRILGFMKTPGEENDVYYPRIAFKTADGRSFEYRSKVGSERPTYQVNDPVEILYDPRQPDEAAIRSFTSLWLFPGILTAIGLGFIGVSTAVTFFLHRESSHSLAGEKRREEMSTRLQASGRKLTLKVAQVYLDTRSSREGRHPYRIICHWQDPATAEIRDFESEPIWFDPQGHLPENVLVYVDPEDANNYQMDTSFLPRHV